MENKTTEYNERTFAPVTDIYETEENYTMVVEMPGVEKEDLNIVIEDDSLEIQGNVKTYSPEDLKLKYSDKKGGSFYRKFRVGNDIDRNNIDAKLTDGTLTLTLSKSEEVKPRKIEIATH